MCHESNFSCFLIGVLIVGFFVNKVLSGVFGNEVDSGQPPGVVDGVYDTQHAGRNDNGVGCVT